MFYQVTINYGDGGSVVYETLATKQDALNYLYERVRSTNDRVTARAQWDITEIKPIWKDHVLTANFCGLGIVVPVTLHHPVPEKMIEMFIRNLKIVTLSWDNLERADRVRTFLRGKWYDDKQLPIDGDQMVEYSQCYIAKRFLNKQT